MTGAPYRSPNVIRVMADYHCHPTWTESGANLDPRSLPLSDALVHDLELWTSEYDATLVAENPAASGFDSADRARAFLEAGRQLTRRIEGELGGTHRVVFFDPSEDAPDALVRSAGPRTP